MAFLTWINQTYVMAGWTDDNHLEFGFRWEVPLRVQDGDTLIRSLITYKLTTEVYNQDLLVDKIPWPWALSFIQGPATITEQLMFNPWSGVGDAIWHEMIEWIPQTCKIAGLDYIKWNSPSPGVPRESRSQRKVVDRTEFFQEVNFAPYDGPASIPLDPWYQPLKVSGTFYWRQLWEVHRAPE